MTILKKISIPTAMFFVFLICLFYPEVAKFISPGPLNLENIVASKNAKIILISACILLGIWDIKILYCNLIVCIIRVDGLDNTTIPKYKLITRRTEEHYYRINLDSNNKKDISNQLIIINNQFNENKSNENYLRYIFYGVAPIPFIFYLGSLYGDDCKKYDFIHPFRKKKNGTYKLKKCKKQYSNLKIITDEMCNNSKELIVKVTTSFQMNENLDAAFIGMDVLKIYSNTFDVDNIDSVTVLEQWSKEIVDCIRKYGEKYDMIHLFLNTSTCMTFKLGTMLTNNYDNKIKVYHYNRKGTITRPWAILFSGNKVDTYITPKSSDIR